MIIVEEQAARQGIHLGLALPILSIGTGIYLATHYPQSMTSALAIPLTSIAAISALGGTYSVAPFRLTSDGSTRFRSSVNFKQFARLNVINVSVDRN